MFEISPLAAVHTVLACAALLTGLLSLARSHEILLTSIPGMCYAYLCAMTCLTGFGLSDHGPLHIHAVRAVTLALLGAAILARSTHLLGRTWRYVEVLGYTTSFFLSLVAAVSESLSQPSRHVRPLDTVDYPLLAKMLLTAAALYAVTLALQLRELRLSESVRVQGGADAPKN